MLWEDSACSIAASSIGSGSTTGSAIISGSETGSDSISGSAITFSSATSISGSSIGSGSTTGSAIISGSEVSSSTIVVSSFIDPESFSSGPSMYIYGSEFLWISSSWLAEAWIDPVPFTWAAGIDETVELLSTCKSIILFDGLSWGSNPVATTETLALPSRFSSKIDPTITSASGWTCSLISFVILSTSCNVKSVPPVMLINNPLAPSKE